MLGCVSHTNFLRRAVLQQGLVKRFLIWANKVLDADA